MTTPEQFARAFGIERRPKDVYKYATVTAVRDNAVNIRLNASVTTECPCLYRAAVGDRAQVVIKADGSVVAIGKAR